MSKVSIAKGMRDFSAEEVSRRQYIISIIREVFETYGFGPLETPSMENLQTLTGKYGDEGDKLIFRVLKSGDFLKSVPENMSHDANTWSSLVSDKALRYDLTVPFARYLATNRNDVKLPFKRYQIQPVWRADRPQKGRYREFVQCDADVVGAHSLWQEVELMQIYATVFFQLNIPVRIRISSRQILAGMAEYANVPDSFLAFCTILDKLDKIGADSVIEQWEQIGVPKEKATKLLELFNLDAEKALGAFAEILPNTTGMDEVRFVLEKFAASMSENNNELVFDPSLARGLDYYTGCIFEVEALDASFGSLGGGGRYADLTGIFGLKDVPGVGISFGLDRIYLVMEEKQLFPETVLNAPEVLGIQFDERCGEATFNVISKLRAQGIAAEFYPQAVRVKKQMDYAHTRNVKFVLLIGEEELNKRVVKLKNMHSGEQTEVDMMAFMANARVYLGK